MAIQYGARQFNFIVLRPNRNQAGTTPKGLRIHMSVLFWYVCIDQGTKNATGYATCEGAKRHGDKPACCRHLPNSRNRHCSQAR